MSPRVLRIGPLPESHLVQFRIKRAEDPELFEFIERIPYGEIAKTLRDVMKRGVAAASEASGQPSNTPSTSLALPAALDAPERVVPSQPMELPGRQRMPPVVPTPKHEESPASPPPLSDTRIDPSLMQLLADEDSMS